MSPPPLPSSYENPVHGDVCSRILGCASRGLLRLEFLSDVARMICEWCGCDAVEVRIVERRTLWCVEASGDEEPPRCEVLGGKRTESGRTLPCREADSDLERLCEELVEGRVDQSRPGFTRGGSFWTSDIHTAFPAEPGGHPRPASLADHQYRSLVITPYELDDDDSGVIVLKSRFPNYFLPHQTESFEHVARILGVAAMQRRVHLALRERVKELTCLYGIARIAARPGAGLDDILQGASELVPKGCLHEDLASARIDFDDRSFSSPRFEESAHEYTQEILVHGSRRGVITLALSRELPELDVGPFIKEELDLLEVVAGELALVIEAREIEEKRKALEEQLRHADRLATIGQLAAGVAHELNEPLVTILGRAQLAAKDPSVPEAAKRDFDKIVAASLHARGVIGKLKLFARRATSRKEEIDLNDVVRDGLALLEEHVTKAEIALETRLDPGLLTVVADSGQLHQVMINLVVNALQATPAGGRILVQTVRRRDGVALVVEDTGSGIDEETLKHIFTPFFTTKDIDEGTGLGLAVVHGIVTAHGGSIRVKSRVGEGSRFEVRLPLSSPDRTDVAGVDQHVGG